MLSAIIAFLSALTVARAVPTLVYPLMDQAPPVGRVGQAFAFEVFPTTFNSTSTITYSAAPLPAWLTFDSASLSFLGTPGAGDRTDGTNIILTAVDPSGFTTSAFTLLVTDFASPAVHQAFPSQIADNSSRVFASVEELPGDTGVSVHPYWSFSLGFAYDTFRLARNASTNGDLYVQARERGTTSLPAWLNFDNDTMTFGGVAPANGSYAIVATGTDYWGYTAAQSSFVISVGEGSAIELTGDLSELHTVARGDVNYPLDPAQFSYNGTAATSDELTFAVDQSQFPWLSVNGNNIVGTTPDSYINGTANTIPVRIVISSSNTSSTLSLNTWIRLDVEEYPFTTFNPPSAQVNPSSAFEYDLSPYMRNSSIDVNATVNPIEAAQWLVYHTANHSLTGNVPSDPQYDHVDVVFSSSPSNAQTSLNITINGVNKHDGTNGTAPVPEKHDGGSSGLSKGAKIGIGLGVGLGVALLLLLLLFCCCRRRRQNKEEQDPKDDDDASFVAGSPIQDPFRKSNGLEAPRNLLGEIARFSGLGMGPQTPTRMKSMGVVEKASISTPKLTHSSSSFLGEGDVISVREPVDRPSQDASSFTQSFESSGSSRASWESEESFHWSSGENDPRYSLTPSIPRPRQDFTPRYPRNNSPSRLAQLASQHSLGAPLPQSEASSDSLTSSHFPSGPNGLNRFGDSSGFKSIDEEDEDNTSSESPAIVSMAERASVNQRPTPKLRPSRERIASADEPYLEQSHHVLAEEGMYDDADDREVQGLGYPASEIFGSPSRLSTIRPVPTHESPLSPPLPQVGSFRRPASIPSSDGRVIACANETFSIHPQIHPPPTVSLSAATWSSAPPSTYRAEVVGGGQLPAWLHFDARELELWGVPALGHAGQTTVIRIVEKMPNHNRRSDPMAFGYEPPQEREVGKITIEVVDRIKSPQFALEGSPHAL